MPFLMAAMACQQRQQQARRLLADEPAVAIVQGFDVVPYAGAHMTRHDAAKHARKVRGKMRKKVASFKVLLHRSALTICCEANLDGVCLLVDGLFPVGLILNKNKMHNINKQDVKRRAASSRSWLTDGTVCNCVPAVECRAQASAIAFIATFGFCRSS